MCCFKQSDTTEIENGVQDDKEETLDSIGRDAAEHDVSLTIGLQNLPNPCDENDIIENLSVKIQGRKVAVVPKIFKVAIKSEDPEGLENKKENSELHLKCVAVAKASIKKQGLLSEICLRVILNFQHALRLEKQN